MISTRNWCQDWLWRATELFFATRGAFGAARRFDPVTIGPTLIMTHSHGDDKLGRPSPFRDGRPFLAQAAVRRTVFAARRMRWIRELARHAGVDRRKYGEERQL